MRKLFRTAQDLSKKLIARQNPTSQKTPQDLGLSPVVFNTFSERRLGDWVDIFRCYFTLQGQVHSVHRNFVLLPTEGYTKGKLQDSNNTLTVYNWVDGALQAQDQRNLGHGTDPRVVSDGETAYVFQLMRRDGDQQKSFYRILKLPDQISFDIEDVAGMPLGKNWQPFLKDGKLFVVFGFDPLKVIEIGEDGSTKVVATQQTQLDIFPPHQKFSMFRGGSNGVVAEDGCVYGFGHLTVRNFRHDIFMWRLDADWNLDVKISSNTIGLKDQGYMITDPTSFFEYDGAIFLGLALSERDWYFDQKFADILVKLDASTLPELFASSGPILPTLNFDPIEPVTLSIPPALCPTDVGGVTSTGAIRNIGRAGYLLKGCMLLTQKRDQRLSSIEIFFKCTEKQENGKVEASVWSTTGQCLDTVTISQRGKALSRLDVSHHFDGNQKEVELRLSCADVDITLENIRAIYAAKSNPKTNEN
ncbi:hypothetical protein [Tritonibacter horizontis]|uniref:hypothetical protein n=1 Tax=Tritonibacter horizontis TaxID=1768241 RepID=UPI0008355D24|nr:hypothetical protein [Tritonibacter horizontis]